jgi:methionyl-tRNA formyltransferase
MKVGYFADGPWSHVALERIVKDGSIDVLFIVPRYDTQDPILKKWAAKLNVPYIVCDDVNSEKFLTKVATYDADLFISMSFNQILKKEIMNLPAKGFINCHAGALPFYRGRAPLNWALINGEKTFGITVHQVDEGIDTGDIIEQRHYAIKIKDDYSSLLDLAIFECAEVLLAALMKIKAGSYHVTKQSEIHPTGSYFGMRKKGDEVVDFSWSAARIVNFVRGVAPPAPGARCFDGSVEFVIEEAELIINAPYNIGTEGEVVGRSGLGVAVKVGDTTIFITKVKKLCDESSASKVPSFRIGTRLVGRK